MAVLTGLARLIVLFAASGLALALSGCVSSIGPAESTPGRADPPATSVPAAPEETASGSPAPSKSTPSKGAEDPGLTSATLTQLCVDKTRSFYASDVVFFPERARIEARKVEPPWLVIVPSHSLGLSGQSVCTIGGSASAPVFEAYAAVSEFTEQEIQDAIDGVVYYEGDG